MSKHNDLLNTICGDVVTAFAGGRRYVGIASTLGWVDDEWLGLIDPDGDTEVPFAFLNLSRVDSIETES